jgi:hypothetical protein
MLQVSQAFDVSRAVSHGWTGVKRQPVGLLLGSLLLTLTEGGGGGSNPIGGKYDWGDGGSSDHKSSAMPTDLWSERIRAALGDAFDLQSAGGIAALIVGLTCLALCVAVVVLFRCWIQAGYLRTHRELVVTGQAGVGTLFSGAPDLVRLLLWKLLSGIVALGVLTVALLPALVTAGIAYALHADRNAIAIAAGIIAFLFVVPTMIYVGIGLAFGDRAVVIDGLGPSAALDRSWSLAKGNRMHLFVFLLLTGLFRLAGILLCCIGIVLTRAIVDTGTTEAYMLATQEGSDAWVLPKEVA